MPESIYKDAVVIARMEIQELRDSIPWWSLPRRRERRALGATIEAFDYIMDADENQALQAIAKIALKTKLLLAPTDPLYKVIMQMMIQIGKKMGPEEGFTVEFPLN